MQRLPSILSILLLSSAATAGEDPFWPQFHGPNRDNIAAEKNLLKKWPTPGPKLLWTAKGLGFGYSTISTAKGLIYTAGNQGKDTVVTALDLQGKTIWQTKNGTAWRKSYPGSRSTPTIDGDRLYHQSPLGDLICLDARTGKKIWQVNTIKMFKSKSTMWALAESVLVTKDHVISSPGGPETCMAAFNKKDGTLAWQAKSTGDLAGYCSPLLIDYQGMEIILNLTAKNFIGVEAKTGKLLWRQKHLSYADENTMTPIFQDGQIFVSTVATGSIKWQLQVKEGKAKLTQLWRTKDVDNHHGGMLLWQGNIYGTSTVRNRNQWVCLDWQSGKTKSIDDNVGKGSLTCADGMLYTLSIQGKVGLSRPTKKGLDLISSFQLPKKGKGPSWAHPVVCGGRMYIRHGDFLFAYEVKKKSI